MANIIDRRDKKNTSADNRRKYLSRNKDFIKDQVTDRILSKSIKELEKQKGPIKIKKPLIDEPIFQEDDNEDRSFESVQSGNDIYKVGDKRYKPQSQNQGFSGEGEDDFEFTLNSNEFLDYLFEDLELPDLVKTSLANTPETKYERAGIVSSGLPSNLNIIRSFRNSMGRNLALGSVYDYEINEIKQKIKKENISKEELDELHIRLEELLHEKEVIPFIDTIDLRYNHRIQVEIPVTSAVMFCIMDVSGSMGKREKYMAKCFYLLLYLFLNKQYENVDIVFIKHTETAEEVDEDDFFYSRATGGTVLSSGLILTKQIIEDRYNPSQYNIYIAHASDGENSPDDNYKSLKVLSDLLPLVQYMAYVEIVPEHRLHATLRGHYDLFSNILGNLLSYYKNLNLAVIKNVKEIYPVFRELFKVNGKDT